MHDSGWVKSTFSTTASDNCVEVRFVGDVTRVRDSKSPAAVLFVDVPALVAAVKAGCLDR